MLRTEEVSVTYGGLRAVDRVTIEVREGEIVGLIGPNGAGKTSFIDAITGFTQSSGEVFLAGEPMSGMAAHARARKGLVRTWQSIELFEDLSAENNVRVERRHRQRRLEDHHATACARTRHPRRPCATPSR